VPALARVRSLWRNLVHRSRVDRELNDELTAVFEAAVAERVRAGLDPMEARRLTHLELGRVDSIVTQVRDTRAGAGLHGVWQDVVFGFRLLRRQPLFAATAVLSLALGIGASTSMFSLVNALLLRDVGVPDPAGLAEFWRATVYGRGTAFSYPAYERLRDERGAFSGVVALAKNTVNGSAGPDAAPVHGRFVSGNFFDVLGVGASAGRTFTAREDRRDDPTGATVTVISYRLWQRAFGGSAGALGQVVRADGVPFGFTIVGVAPAAFDDLVIGRSADFYIPLGSEPLFRTNSLLRSAPSNWLAIVGRLKPGVTRDAAAATLEPAFASFLVELASDLTDADARRRTLAQRVFLEPARNGISDIRRDTTRPVVLLMSAVVVVLVIACANVVNLLLAGGIARRREIALRLAIGASRRRVIRQLLTEALLLGAAGAAAGLALCFFAAPVLLSLMSQGGVPLDVDVAPDRTILLFTTAMAIASSLAAGVLPAVRIARVDITPSFQGDARTLRVTRESSRWGNALIAAQVALSVVLVAGASLLVTTLRNIHNFDPGFVAERVVLLSVDAARVGYAGEALDRYYRDVLDRARALPGVAAASLSAVTPIAGGGIDLPVAVDDRPREPDVMVLANRMSEGFFATMSIPVLLGRDFVVADRNRPGGAVIVNETLARKYFPVTNPLGHRLTLGPYAPREIVGVVANSKYTTLRQPDLPTAYINSLDNGPDGMTLSVRTIADPRALAASVRDVVRSVAPNVPISQPRMLTSQVERSLTTERLIARLLSAFAILALVLASVGLHGVLGYAVVRRTAEIGLRLALGATRHDVLGSVVRQSLRVVAMGLAIGLPATMLLTRPLAGLLFGVRPADPRILAAATAALIAVAIGAAAVPAWRAARVDPLIALRHE
jgi:predicted permease